jgi:hypothetical protein
MAPTNPHPTPPADSDLPPLDTHASQSMGWVLVLWLVCFLTVVVFGVISYLFGWWFTKG